MAVGQVDNLSKNVGQVGNLSENVGQVANLPHNGQDAILSYRPINFACNFGN